MDVVTSLAVVPVPSPGGVPDVRRANLGRVLRALRATAPNSRAGLAAVTGLTKATVSAVVVDLAGRGLLVEGDVARDGSVGSWSWPGPRCGRSGSRSTPIT